MKKIELVVHIPGLNDKQRFLLPDNMQIGQCVHLILMLIAEEYPAVRYKEENLRLFKASTGEVLSNTTCLAKLDISVNDELILG